MVGATPSDSTCCNTSSGSFFHCDQPLICLERFSATSVNTPVLVQFLVLVLNAKFKYLYSVYFSLYKKINPAFKKKKNQSLGQFWNHCVSMALTWCSFQQQGIANKHFSFKTLVTLLFASNSVFPFQNQLFRGLWALSNTVRHLDGISQVPKLICPSLFLVCLGFFLQV